MDATRFLRTRLAYRADIDGLRALAVAAVLGFHALPEAAPGGFAGVDVFFVISGFLITQLLLREQEAAGGIDLVAFYRRRLRRIVPALAVVLAVTLSLGWFILLPQELARLGSHVLGAAVFISNFQYWTSWGYFAPGAEHTPLLHLWSLAIEEQFYLAWPPALMLLARFPRRRPIIVALAMAASLLACLLGDDAVTGFYSPVSRAWELLAGALVALRAAQAPAPAGAPACATPGAELAVLLGLALIVGAALALGAASPWPGWRTLLPVGGAVLVLAFGQRSALAQALLANRAAVFVGLVSYPLYLWHWPLLSFAHILHAGVPPLSVRLGALAIAFAAAVATWRLLERPIRFGRWRRPAPLLLALALASFAGLGLATWRSGGFPGRAITAANATALTAALGQGKELTRPGCLGIEPPLPQAFMFCSRDATLIAPFVVWGDSKAEALYWGLVRDSHARAGGGWQLAGRSGCPPMGGKFSTWSPLCDAVNEQALARIVADPAIRTVVLAAGVRTLRYNGLEGSFDGLEASVKALLAAGKRVIFLTDNPTLVGEREEAVDCARRTGLPLLERLVGRRDCDLPLAAHRAATADYRQALAGLLARNPQLVLFDADPLLCSQDGICHAAREGRMLYSYGDHISDTGNGLIARKLAPLAQ